MQERWLEHLEKLAALSLNETERHLLRDDLTRIINFAAELPERGNDEIQVLPPPHLNNSFDKKHPSAFSLAAFIAEAPNFKDGFLQTPPIWQDENEGGND